MPCCHIRTYEEMCIRDSIMAVIKSVEEKYMKEALKQAKKAYALGEKDIERK